MPNQTAKFVSAIFISSFANIAIAATLDNAARVADSCLSGPKGAAPQGGHWYYRVDRATKRHCWYVGDARAKLPRVSSSPSGKSPAPQEEIATQRSAADARAELPMPQTRTEQSIEVGAAQRMPAISADVAAGENNQTASPRDANAQRPTVIASRWPDQSSASSSTGSGLTASKLVSNVPADSTAAPLPATATIQLATADALPQTRARSIQTLLIVVVSALTLAGLMGSLIFRFGSMRSAGRGDLGNHRRAIWESTDTDRPSPPVYPRADIPARREANASNDRIVEMLSRLSRSAAG